MSGRFDRVGAGRSHTRNPGGRAAWCPALVLADRRRYDPSSKDVFGAPMHSGGLSATLAAAAGTPYVHEPLLIPALPDHTGPAVASRQCVPLALALSLRPGRRAMTCSISSDVAAPGGASTVAAAIAGLPWWVLLVVFLASRLASLLWLVYQNPSLMREWLALFCLTSRVAVAEISFTGPV